MKQASIGILISETIDFKPKLARRDRGHNISIKGKSLQEDTEILNIYAPITRLPKLIKETLLQLKSHIEPYTSMAGNCIPHSWL